MQKNLVIVESPAKAKTIGNFLGDGYAVTSSMGHVRDLKKKGLGIDVNNNFQPDYEISSDKVKLVAELRKAAKGADKVLLAPMKTARERALHGTCTRCSDLSPTTMSALFSTK